MKVVVCTVIGAHSRIVRRCAGDRGTASETADDLGFKHIRGDVIKPRFLADKAAESANVLAEPPEHQVRTVAGPVGGDAIVLVAERVETRFEDSSLTRLCCGILTSIAE